MCSARSTHAPAAPKATPHTHRPRGSVLLALALTAAVAGAHPAAADRPDGNAVVHWNAVATDVFTPSQGTNPMAQSRTLAIVHAAIHDALNAIDRRFKAYTTGVDEAPGASVDAAVAAAARDVLVALLPDQAAVVEAAYGRALAAVPEGPAKTAGIATGQASAAANMTRRHRDGFEEATQPAYVPRPGPGEYQFTPPFNFAAQPGWGQVKPFIIDVREHAVDGPQRLSSTEYARDLAQVKAMGDINSTVRTPEQSEIAQFWYEDSPLGWNRIANTAVRQRQTGSLVRGASVRAGQLRHGGWVHCGLRGQVSVSLLATGDGDPRGRDRWQPLHGGGRHVATVLDHTACAGLSIDPYGPRWAAAEVLIELLGDSVRYDADSLTLPGVIRHFKGFSAAAEENGLSRFYAGIHFPHAVRDGRRQGRSVGRAVAEALGPMR